MQIKAILNAAEIYAKQRSLSLSTVSTYAVNDGKWLPGLQAGAGCTIKKATVFIDWLSENWPDNEIAWPSDIPRPTPNKKEAA